MTKGFQRLHLRSPFMSDVLYVSEDHVHKGRTVNISEGGVLLENLPHVPEINAMPLMIALTQFPSFSQLSADYLRTMELSHFDRKIIRSKARLVRSFEGQSAVEKVFVQKVGCEFVLPSEETKQAIADYVQMSAKNIIFLLGLFQKSSQVEVLRNVAKILGYNDQEKLTLLRQKVLHDYQSLESL